MPRWSHIAFLLLLTTSTASGFVARDIGMGERRQEMRLMGARYDLGLGKNAPVGGEVARLDETDIYKVTQHMPVLQPVRKPIFTGTTDGEREVSAEDVQKPRLDVVDRSKLNGALESPETLFPRIVRLKDEVVDTKFDMNTIWVETLIREHLQVAQ